MTEEGGMLVTKFLAGVGLVVAAALLLRTLGRLSTPAYLEFSRALAAARSSPEARQRLGGWDFHFSAWPADFDVRSQGG